MTDDAPNPRGRQEARGASLGSPIHHDWALFLSDRRDENIEVAGQMVGAIPQHFEEQRRSLLVGAVEDDPIGERKVVRAGQVARKNEGVGSSRAQDGPGHAGVVVNRSPLGVEFPLPDPQERDRRGG